jgi:uncharacterized membrane protein YkvA (DUF1232 family)
VVSATHWMLLGLASALTLYLLGVVALVLAGRRADARALAGFIPDCALLVRALLRDPRVPKGSKLLLVALAAYLVMPFDLVPDLIPVAGQLDDAVLAALVLRAVLRESGPALVREHWRGPQRSVDAILRLC